jgi:uncharacterized membrane protein
MNRQNYALRDSVLGVILLIVLVAVTVWLMRAQRTDRDDAARSPPTDRSPELVTP